MEVCFLITNWLLCFFYFAGWSSFFFGEISRSLFKFSWLFCPSKVGALGSVLVTWMSKIHGFSLVVGFYKKKNLFFFRVQAGRWSWYNESLYVKCFEGMEGSTLNQVRGPSMAWACLAKASEATLQDVLIQNNDTCRKLSIVLLTSSTI